MRYFTTDTYETKRKILDFVKKLSTGCGQVETKFLADSIYGILTSGSVLICDIAEALQESIKKINTEERLCRNMEKEQSPVIMENYMKLMSKQLDDSPVILVDDSDVIKPYGKAFESMGTVRDGSSRKKAYENGYVVTEMTGLTKNKNQPVSLFSHMHSSVEKGYKSTNTVTYTGLDNIIKTLDRRATFIFDRGYDMNELFNFMYNKEQDFVIRIKENRKLWYKGKWYMAPTLRDSRKGKIKTTVLFQGEQKECYISHINTMITASKKPMRLVLVYGLGEVPMMLATNKVIEKKEDVIGILRLYLSRWRVEEYFRFKKQEFDFENYRVRGLRAMNNLNTLLTYAVGFIGMLMEKQGRNGLTDRLIANSKSFKEKLLFYYYQVARGIVKTMKLARSGIADWKHIRHDEQFRQLSLKLVS